MNISDCNRDTTSCIYASSYRLSALFGQAERFYVGGVRECGEGPFIVGETRVPAAQGGRLIGQFTEDEGGTARVQY